MSHRCPKCEQKNERVQVMRRVVGTYRHCCPIPCRTGCPRKVTPTLPVRTPDRNSSLFSGDSVLGGSRPESPSRPSLGYTGYIGKQNIFYKTNKSHGYIFLNDHTHDRWKFLGQGLNLSHSCNLRHSCGNVGSFNLLCVPGIEPALLQRLSYCCQSLNSLYHSGNSDKCQKNFFNYMF